ncbi:hypothetical protein C0995_015562 [Termitomyces sp. Mi166|nr:hypothetical protein C0995_015562 [Termitomyces sp. Mi166\
MVVELELTVPAVVLKASVVLVPMLVSVALSSRHVPSVSYMVAEEPSSPPMQGKGEAKATEEDNDDEDKTTQRLWKELENFIALTTVPPVSMSKVVVLAPVPAALTAKPAKKGASVAKDPFMIRHFKLAGTKESGMLIINQVTEVPASRVVGEMQKTLRSDNDTSNKDNEDGEGENDGGEDA